MAVEIGGKYFEFSCTILLLYTSWCCQIGLLDAVVAADSKDLKVLFVEESNKRITAPSTLFEVSNNSIIQHLYAIELSIKYVNKRNYYL